MTDFMILIMHRVFTGSGTAVHGTGIMAGIIMPDRITRFTAMTHGIMAGTTIRAFTSIFTPDGTAGTGGTVGDTADITVMEEVTGFGDLTLTTPHIHTMVTAVITAI